MKTTNIDLLKKVVVDAEQVIHEVEPHLKGKWHCIEALKKSLKSLRYSNVVSVNPICGECEWRSNYEYTGDDGKFYVCIIDELPTPRSENCRHPDQFERREK